MAKCVPSGVYGRLKDQAASILEKLKLAYDVWFAKSDVLPNKHQIIIDTVVGFLLNKKKKFELTQEEEKQVWNNLYEFLSSKNLDECGKYGSTLLIKPSLAQVILDYLEMCITEWESVEKHGRETLSSVIGCCRVIIGTSSLSYVLTSRPEVLIALTGSLCQLWHLGQVSENSESEVSVLLSEQCKHLWYHLRCHPNQAQMLKVVTEKLLLPVVHLVHDVKTITRLNKFKVCVESLQEFVVNTVFHEDHERLVKTFLDVVTKHQDTSQIPRLIDNFFTKILSCLKEKDIPAKSKSSDTKAALHFLPVIFQHASRKWKKYPQQCFQLLCFFLTSLGMPEEGQVEKIMDDHVATVSHLLSLVHDCGIYNVVADKIGGEVQLKYFRHVLQVLLQTDKHEDVCKCMLTFLQLNHLILEPYMLKVLDHCCSIHIQEQGRNKSYNLDVFMSELISTYSQLHQTPKWMNFILAYNDSNPRAVPMLFSLQTFSNRYGQVMCSLPYSTALDMWTKFVEQIHTHVQGFLNENEASSAKLWGSTLLFHEFISHVRLFDASVTGKAVEKIQALQKELEEKIILPCKKLIIQKGKDELACRSCLLLAYCLGNVKVMLMQYKTSRADPDQFLVKENDLPFSLKPHELLKVKKSLDEDVVLHYLADLLTVQKLQAFEEVETMCLAKKPEVQSFLTFFKETTSCTDFSQTWNGSIATINNGNYLLATFFHVAQKVPFLLPIMLLENCDDLSKFLVDIFSKPIICSPTKEGRHTLRSTAQMLLCNSAAAESRQLLSVLICTLWKEMCTEFSPPGSESHKKKRTVPSKHQTVLCSLGESDILWSEHSESRVQSVGQLVNAVLECEDVQPIVLSVSQKTCCRFCIAYLWPIYLQAHNCSAFWDCLHC
ncbi:unhealthy ribosome biogenesis protein 2 homolog isoform X2 [Pomacea canaliculata]|uniref:unhealthy ribosome biogenesis protein 2 homolog isoform X2 n=1 Tax=Pomacea canaliculata TaxID=400727 RepID=UPI000D72D287|nr:unhealthy ribosome biogenesis protein 2 homolog isoform X2 [Pomacea canaliculata]